MAAEQQGVGAENGSGLNGRISAGEVEQEVEPIGGGPRTHVLEAVHWFGVRPQSVQDPGHLVRLRRLT
ncbi:hypothetical protein ACFRAR_00350 [Kitasatospora sp. NPDC056651]|uniref:hypothetical protein n=1 Tax=Kitasatospora sp. NPDC056651 TaxID=3345892 RepID=UPI00368517F3